MIYKKKPALKRLGHNQFLRLLSENLNVFHFGIQLAKIEPTRAKIGGLSQSTTEATETSPARTTSV